MIQLSAFADQTKRGYNLRPKTRLGRFQFLFRTERGKFVSDRPFLYSGSMGNRWVLGRRDTSTLLTCVGLSTCRHVRFGWKGNTKPEAN
jgi:hypothetical protein